jgi:hypothetical protein
MTMLIFLVSPKGIFTDKLSINLFIYESGPNDEKIEDVLFMQIQILNLVLIKYKDCITLVKI